MTPEEFNNSILNIKKELNDLFKKGDELESLIAKDMEDIKYE